MKIIKMSDKLFLDLFTEGNNINITIEKGLPKDCKLAGIRYIRDKGIIEFDFLEIEDVEVIDMKVKSNEGKL